MNSEDTVSWKGDDGEASVPGGTIGRFTIVGSLGAGGMGVVVAAHDPMLDRKVAIKLLRPGRWRGEGEQGRARLAREAQAMARVQHPNVATVYDVGDLGDQLFVAMELVDGQTLADWLRERPRTPREIVAMLVAAGRGLAAVHEAGLVHCDFKPDNVLIGRDGRPRVTDFGLARLCGPRAVAAHGAATTPSVAGTPAYMSPEQARGEPADARSDQYSYCVTLYEALYGERPFRDGDAAERREAPTRPRRRRDVAAWVFEVLRRGLTAEPSARWPDMTALLTALAHDRTRRRRTIVASGAVLGVIGWAAWSSRASHVDPCAGGQARMAQVWDDARKQAVHAAFTATRASFASDTWQRVATRLDAYADAWVEMQRAACRATRVEGRQSDTLLDLRMSCLEQRRNALGALVATWGAGIDRDALAQAVDAADRLASLDACADVSTLTERVPLPSDPGTRLAIASVRAHLDTVGALAAIGRRVDSAREAEAARREADTIGWVQIRAEAAYAQGTAREQLDDPKAEAPLLDAEHLGEQARDDRLVTRAMIELTHVIGYDEQQLARSLMVADLAEGKLARIPEGEALRAELLLVRGIAETEAARYDDARRDLERATQLHAGPHGDPVGWINALHALEVLADRVDDHEGAKLLAKLVVFSAIVRVGPSHPMVADGLHSLANAYEAAGDLPQARRVYQHALTLKREIYGEASAAYALTLSNLGNVEYGQGNISAAASDYERAIAIREQVFGPDHPFVAMSLDNLASLRTDQNRLAEARGLFERALAIKLAAYGADSPSLAYVLINLGRVFKAQGDLARARAELERALAIRTKALGAESAAAQVPVVHLGTLDVREGKLASARARFRQAIAVLEKREPNGGMLMAALANLGELELRVGQASTAVPCLERAIAISTAAGRALGTRGSVRAQLARALWASGRHAEARVAAQTADGELASGGADSTGELRALRAWTTAHRR